MLDNKLLIEHLEKLLKALRDPLVNIAQTKNYENREEEFTISIPDESSHNVAFALKTQLNLFSEKKQLGLEFDFNSSSFFCKALSGKDLKDGLIGLTWDLYIESDMEISEELRKMKHGFRGKTLPFEDMGKDHWDFALGFIHGIRCSDRTPFDFTFTSKQTKNEDFKQVFYWIDKVANHIKPADRGLTFKQNDEFAKFTVTDIDKAERFMFAMRMMKFPLDRLDDLQLELESYDKPYEVQLEDGRYFLELELRKSNTRIALEALCSIDPDIDIIKLDSWRLNGSAKRLSSEVKGGIERFIDLVEKAIPIRQAHQRGEAVANNMIVSGVEPKSSAKGSLVEKTRVVEGRS